MTPDSKADDKMIATSGYNHQDNAVAIGYQMGKITAGTDSLNENSGPGDLHFRKVYSNSHSSTQIITKNNTVQYNNASFPLSRPNHNPPSLTNVDRGDSMHAAQGVQSLGFVSRNLNMNSNYHHHHHHQHQINTFSNSLNTAGVTLNNLPFPGFRNDGFVPDASVSFQNYNAQFSQAESMPMAASQRYRNRSNGARTVMEEQTFTLRGVERAEKNGEVKYGSMQTLEEGSSTVVVNRQLDNDKSFINSSVNREAQHNTKRSTTNEIRGMRNFPIAKRMRQTEEKQLRQIELDWLIPTSNEVLSGNSFGISRLLYTESDARNLSQYQCLARKQMEIFETTPDNAGTNAQGRNKPILPGQVGIRCRHCYALPPKERRTGSVYYPNKLEGVYQTAQKMTVGHLSKHCAVIPDEIRKQLVFLKNQKSSDGGGKRYWANGVRMLGVIETPHDGLAFEKPPSQVVNNQLHEKNVTMSAVI